MMSAGSLESFISHEFEDKVDPAKTDGVTADDVIAPIIKILAPGSFTDNKDQFLTHLSSDKETKFRLDHSHRETLIITNIYNIRPMGELVTTLNNDGDQFEVYKCDESTPRFRDYHERLQVT